MLGHLFPVYLQVGSYVREDGVQSSDPEFPMARDGNVVFTPPVVEVNRRWLPVCLVVS